MLPQHRELAATCVIPEMVRARSFDSHADVVLVPLAEADGEPGPGLYAVMVYALGAKNASTRAAATDALLILTTRHQLDPSGLAAVFALLLERRDINGKRIVEPMLAPQPRFGRRSVSLSARCWARRPPSSATPR